MSGYDDPGLLGRLATNLFHGWGYDFYGQTNRLRADDQLIRSQVGQLLGAAQADVVAAELAYRRARIAPPSRAQPFPIPPRSPGRRRSSAWAATSVPSLVGFRSPRFRPPTA